MIHSYLKNKMSKEEDDIISEAEKEFEKYVGGRKNYKISPSTETKLLDALDQLDTAASELQYDMQKEETKDRIKKVKEQYRLHKKEDREIDKSLYSILWEYKSIKEDISQFPSKAEKGEKNDENNR